ncbi:hypothetical protein C5167_034869, partial [Papaver somniferum]
MCIIAVRNECENSLNAMLKNVIGTLDFRINYLLQGETYPEFMGIDMHLYTEGPEYGILTILQSAFLPFSARLMLSVDTYIESGIEVNSGGFCGRKDRNDGQFCYLHRTSNTSPTNILRPLHQYLKQSGISSSRKLLSEASSDQTPVANPLSSPVLQIGDGTTETQAVVPKRASVQAVLKDIKQYVAVQSPKKVIWLLHWFVECEWKMLCCNCNLHEVAEEPLCTVIHSARANATHNHGLDKDRLLVAEAFVGKGLFKKRVSYHAKGRSGMKTKEYTISASSQRGRGDWFHISSSRLPLYGAPKARPATQRRVSWLEYQGTRMGLALQKSLALHQVVAVGGAGAKEIRCWRTMEYRGA